ncbi:MAG: nucleotidyl transferase AbiEii/AbiGii toxin family protein [Candidatus Giovannonibacteria bacterium]|nr:nucleotidyl transferase AbiEii/AbiGii toxin family protein [Candidatus Giovannonibacteria bacterium]
MISIETLEKLGRQYQMGVFPNIVREYFQHVFLGELYKLPDAEKLLFKGGTALRIVYGSPRFSEDLDFSLFGIAQNEIKSFVEGLFVHVLAEMARADIKVELGDKIGATSGGYFGVASFRMFEYPPVGVEINVSSRKGMLSLEQKKKLGLIKGSIVAEAKKINFKNELGAFLPVDQQGIIRDFSATLERELNSQLSGE